MNELTKRALSGTLYVALLSATMLLSPLSFFIVIGLFSVLALWEFQRLIEWTSFGVPSVFLALLTMAYMQTIPQEIIQLLLIGSLVCNTWITLVVLTQKKPDFTFGLKLSWTFFYLLASCLFIPLCLKLGTTSAPYLLLIFYAAIWTNNSFAYLFGSRFGKTKLFPALSPKKSWEGYFGGALMTLAFLYIIEQNMQLYGKYWWIVGLFIPLFATVGDLIQSYFKRRAKVKDSGSLLPGHGGFYDRMDSVIYTAPFYYLLLKLI